MTSSDSSAMTSKAGRRPLLVLLDRDYDSAFYWSTYLELTSSAGLADLALCDLVFESQEATRERLDASSSLRTAVAVLIDAPGAPAVLIGRPESVPNCTEFLKPDVADRVRPWLDAQERSLHTAIAPDDATFTRRANVVLGASARTRIAREMELTRLGRERLRLAAPRGSQWRHAGGCVELRGDGEGNQAAGYSCGIGNMPEAARRFLRAYTAKRTDGVTP